MKTSQVHVLNFPLQHLNEIFSEFPSRREHISTLYVEIPFLLLHKKIEKCLQILKSRASLLNCIKFRSMSLEILQPDRQTERQVERETNRQTKRQIWRSQ